MEATLQTLEASKGPEQLPATGHAGSLRCFEGNGTQEPSLSAKWHRVAQPPKKGLLNNVSAEKASDELGIMDDGVPTTATCVRMVVLMGLSKNFTNTAPLQFLIAWERLKMSAFVGFTACPLQMFQVGARRIIENDGFRYCIEATEKWPLHEMTLWKKTLLANKEVVDRKSLEGLVLAFKIFKGRWLKHSFHFGALELLLCLLVSWLGHRQPQHDLTPIL